MEYLLLLLCSPFLIMAVYHRKIVRVIEDTPNTRIDSAAQGMVEIKARTIRPKARPLTVPHLGIPCVWYRHEVEVIDESQQASLGKETHDTIYIEDDSGQCAVEPLHAEMHARRHKEVREGNEIHHLYWIGIDDVIYVLGYMASLHPRPRVNDEIQMSNGDVRYYGQIKSQAHRIIKPPMFGMPFIISTEYEHKLIDKYKQSSLAWFGLFFGSLFLGYYLITNHAVS